MEKPSLRQDGLEGAAVEKSPMEKFKNLATRLVAVSRSDLERQREISDAKNAVKRPKR